MAAMLTQDGEIKNKAQDTRYKPQGAGCKAKKAAGSTSRKTIGQPACCLFAHANHAQLYSSPLGCLPKPDKSRSRSMVMGVSFFSASASSLLWKISVSNNLDRLSSATKLAPAIFRCLAAVESDDLRLKPRRPCEGGRQTQS